MTKPKSALDYPPHYSERVAATWLRQSVPPRESDVVRRRFVTKRRTK